MHTLQLNINDATFSYSVPGSWDEVPKNLYKKVAQTSAYRNAFQARLQLLLILSGMPKKHFKLLVKMCIEASAGQLLNHEKTNSINELTGLVDFAFDTKNLIIYSSKLPRIGLLKGPQNGMHNITAEQWGDAYDCYQFYAKTKDENVADLLIASLYWPYLVGYTPWLLNTWAKVCKKVIRQETKQLAIINYIGLLAEWRKNFEAVFPNELSDDADWPDDSAIPDFESLLIDASGEKLGSIKQTKRLKASTVFKFIQKSLENYNKQKRLNK